MFTYNFCRGVSIVLLTLAACAPLVPSPGGPQTMPSPGSQWTLTLRQSGGFAGVNLTAQVSSDGTLVATNERTGQTVTQALGQGAVAQLRQLFSGLRIAQPQPPRSPCADCFLYSLELSSGGQVTRVEADDTTLAQSGAADLIHFIQRLRDQALKAAP